MSKKQTARSGKRVKSLALKSVRETRGKNVRGGREASAPSVSEIVVTKDTDKASVKIL